MTIETQFDVSFIAALALKEKQIQQNYRPIIAVHKWFARRPGTLFRGLILSEFSDRPLAETFFESNDFAGKKIADPFMGGGIPLLEANRVGCDVQGFDINPMAAWIVREEIEHIDLKSYRDAADDIVEKLTTEIGAAYRTDCPLYGDKDVPVKYFLWVKTFDCEQCGRTFDLFPGYLLADDTRHPLNILICPDCGDLNEVSDIKNPGSCKKCSHLLVRQGPARRSRCDCPYCGHTNTYPKPKDSPPRHRMFAIEYYNPYRKGTHKGRFFKKPSEQDIVQYQNIVARWQSLTPLYVPKQKILSGDETDRLHRWGYRYYRELFNERQLLGLELSGRLIAKIHNKRLRFALATNMSDLLRYQNMLCRYDTMALKSLDIFSVHGFPVGLVQCESNFLGIINDNKINVGSGGWSNIIDKYVKAKRYCEQPFEVKNNGGRKTVVPIKNEWIGESLNGARHRSISIRATSSTALALPPASLDAVFTDPPYFGNVQYGELMNFCYVWLRRLIGTNNDFFSQESSISPYELTGNTTQKRGLEHFTEGLSSVYKAMAKALKPGAPLAFTFHHNNIDVYHAVGVAILDSGLNCCATLPCPAEMGGSIHIHGTGSSIIDTVFVCRSSIDLRSLQYFKTYEELGPIIFDDLRKLHSAGRKPTLGDIRCIVFGHITRMGICLLRKNWDNFLPIPDKLDTFAKAISSFDNPTTFIEKLFKTKLLPPSPVATNYISY